jgi:hypothetical protein
VVIDSHATKNGELQAAGEGMEPAGESTCISIDDQNGRLFGMNGCPDSIDSSIFLDNQTTKRA